VNALLAELNAIEQQIRSRAQRITLGIPSAGWFWVGERRVSLFPRGMRIVATDPGDGTETHWRVIEHDMNAGELLVERW
jgi:hypothetical protein